MDKSIHTEQVPKVVLNGTCSSSIPVSSGVPQGTVLGPLLFLLYVNDLPDCINNSTITPFADDCIVYRHISNSDEQDINSIAEWASSWQMKFNVTKCCCVHFSSSQTGYFSNIYMLYNTLLPCSNHFKYLGITLQSDLKWDQHNY